MNYGWICPRCNTVNAPYIDICKNCSPVKEHYADEIIKSLDNIPSDYNYSKGAFANLLARDCYFEWDTERLLYKQFENNIVINDIAWKQIAAWWILINNEFLTIVVKGMSGFLYSFDCIANIDTSLFIEKVFRYYLKDKEIK